MDQYNKFLALPREKQLQIIGAAKAEFIQSGFTGASTNRIAAKAGIAKGSLFNYFGSKENLYIYLIHLCEGQLFERLTPVFRNLSSDLIQRLKSIAEAYLNLYIEDVESFRFLITLTYPGNLELAQRYREESKGKSARQLNAMFEGLDLTNIRLDYQDILQVIVWTMSGLKDSLFHANQEYHDPVQFKNNFMKNFSLLLDVLKNGIYNQEDI